MRQGVAVGKGQESRGQLARYETIKKFWIVPEDFTVEAGELTPTMKLKRRVVVAKYQRQLDTLY